jgi:hypothetical protein
MPKLRKELPTPERPEIIIINVGLAKSMAQSTFSTVLLVSMISLGKYVDSAAMQWVGAFLGFVVLITLAKRMMNDDRLTITEARERLDEIEAVREHYESRS